MYRFSRSIYCELAPRIHREEGDDEAYAAATHELLKACEGTIKRLATDHRYFARPVQTLFADVRGHFALTEQVHVYMVIERYIDLAAEYLESLPEDVLLNGRPRRCPAITRKGTPCRRDPRPDREYCPSHRHLEEAPVRDDNERKPAGARHDLRGLRAKPDRPRRGGRDPRRRRESLQNGR